MSGFSEATLASILTIAVLRRVVEGILRAAVVSIAAFWSAS